MTEYKLNRNFENLERRLYPGVGLYGIPQIDPINFEGNCAFIGFNLASGCKDRNEKGVHFFLDDYQFNRLWNNIDRYVSMLSDFQYVMSPDFSTYADFPKAIQIYNHYRKHWVAAYLQEHQVNVIPTISWSTPDSYEWCFDGEPVGATVAVSSVGCMKQKEARGNFIEGYNEMIKRLSPTKILFYGNVPEECTGNIVRIKAFQEKFRGALRDGR
ncbi:MAG: DUF4417 domain-containing protein [Oscillospiraceae bacterium]|nr:DUF4417 domain-containing protein [Oscillospiraceae bacterium]